MKISISLEITDLQGFSGSDSVFEPTKVRKILGIIKIPYYNFENYAWGAWSRETELPESKQLPKSK